MRRPVERVFHLEFWGVLKGVGSGRLTLAFCHKFFGMYWSGKRSIVISIWRCPQVCKCKMPLTLNGQKNGNEWIMICADGLVKRTKQQQMWCLKMTCMDLAVQYILQPLCFIPGFETALGLRLRAESLEHLSLQIESERRDAGMPRRACKS